MVGNHAADRRWHMCEHQSMEFSNRAGPHTQRILWRVSFPPAKKRAPMATPNADARSSSRPFVGCRWHRPDRSTKVATKVECGPGDAARRVGAYSRPGVVVLDNPLRKCDCASPQPTVFLGLLDGGSSIMGVGYALNGSGDGATPLSDDWRGRPMK
jgi:hypothetical protein